MNISKFTQKSVEAVQGCEKLAYEYGNQQIDQEHGQQDHKDHQNHILQFAEKFIPPESRDFFEERDLMQQILDQSKGTQPAADQPSDQSPHKNEKSRYIKSQLKVPAPNDSLERADGTGSQRPGAGIAIQTGNTEIFQLSLIDFALQEAG